MMKKGFTLIELSISLVIIGLLVGGILVGQDLIKAAQIRKQITQFENYRAAIGAFELKYKFLPGDLPAAIGLKYGLGNRPAAVGRGNDPARMGNGNGIIGDMESWNMPANGESGIFWGDLSSTQLITERFTMDWYECCISSYGAYFPGALLGHGSLIFVRSINSGNYSIASFPINTNYFGVIANPTMGGGGPIGSYTYAFTVNEAYAMDTKMDDGLPATGRVVANSFIAWGAPNDYTNRVAIGASNGTCFDNGGAAGVDYKYTMIFGGQDLSCLFSVRFD